MAEESYNAGDPRAVQERTVKVNKEHQQLLADVTAVMNTPEGARFVRHLIGKFGVFRSSYHPSAQIYFNEGMRNAGLDLWALIEEANPQFVLRLLKSPHGQSE